MVIWGPTTPEIFTITPTTYISRIKSTFFPGPSVPWAPATHQDAAAKNLYMLTDQQQTLVWKTVKMW